MCSECVRMHLLRMLDTVKAQLDDAAEPDYLELVFEPCKPCRPFELNQNAYCNRRRRFTFPGESDQDAARFTTLVRLCGLLLENLTIGKVATIRDLYYQDVALFRTQNNVVQVLDRITKLLLVPRGSLNVLPSPNGLVAGDLTIAMDGGTVLEVLRSNGPSLIPASAVMHVSALRTPAFLLVVEKEAVFTHLQDELPDGILISGKGFPDRATRQLVKLLTVTYPDMPVFGLFDSDPHGILILRNYEHGSESSIERQESLRMTYLGVRLLEYSEGLVPLTPNDIRVSMSTLQKAWIHEPRYCACKTELQRGLYMHQKGEMNLLDGNRSQRLSEYVQTKIRELLVAAKTKRTSRPGKPCRPRRSKPLRQGITYRPSIAYARRPVDSKSGNMKSLAMSCTPPISMSKRRRARAIHETALENLRDEEMNMDASQRQI